MKLFQEASYLFSLSYGPKSFLRSQQSFSYSRNSLLLCLTNVHYCVHKIPEANESSQHPPNENPFQHYLPVHMPRSFKRCLPLRCTNQNLVCTSQSRDSSVGIATDYVVRVSAGARCFSSP
jgi:hypothetical protein